MLGFLGREVVSVPFLCDPGVGAVAAVVTALVFERFRNGTFTVEALCGGGKIPPGL